MCIYQLAGNPSNVQACIYREQTRRYWFLQMNLVTLFREKSDAKIFKRVKYCT